MKKNEENNNQKANTYYEMSIALAFSFTSFLMTIIYRSRFSNQNLMMFIATVLLVFGVFGFVKELFKDKKLGSTLGTGATLLVLGYFVAKIRNEIWLYFAMLLYFLGFAMFIDVVIKVIEQGPKDAISTPKEMKKQIIELIMVISAFAGIVAAAYQVIEFYIGK